MRSRVRKPLSVMSVDEELDDEDDEYNENIEDGIEEGDESKDESGVSDAIRVSKQRDIIAPMPLIGIDDETTEDGRGFIVSPYDSDGDRVALSSPSSSTHAASGISTLSVPSELLDLFWDEIQKEIFEHDKQQKLVEFKVDIKEAKKAAFEKLRLERSNEAMSQKDKSSEWACMACTFNNQGVDARCSMCGVPRNDRLIYFEVEILSRGRSCSIGVGFGTLDHPENLMPGHAVNSYGWHGDDNNLYSFEETGKSYGPPWSEGDVIGCGLWIDEQIIFYTHNGVFCENAFTEVPILDYVPIVGFHSAGEAVALNTGQLPFEYKTLPKSFVRRPDIYWLEREINQYLYLTDRLVREVDPLDEVEAAKRCTLDARGPVLRSARRCAITRQQVNHRRSLQLGCLLRSDR